MLVCVSVKYWPVLKQSENTIGLSLYESGLSGKNIFWRDESETVNAFASLSVVREDSPVYVSFSRADGE